VITKTRVYWLCVCCGKPERRYEGHAEKKEACQKEKGKEESH